MKIYLSAKFVKKILSVFSKRSSTAVLDFALICLKYEEKEDNKCKKKIANFKDTIYETYLEEGIRGNSLNSESSLHENRKAKFICEITGSNPKIYIKLRYLFPFFFDILARMNHKPIAYITKSKNFFNDNFFVDRGVLIPREESELLVYTSFFFVVKYAMEKLLRDFSYNSFDRVNTNKLDRGEKVNIQPDITLSKASVSLEKELKRNIEDKTSSSYKIKKKIEEIIKSIDNFLANKIMTYTQICLEDQLLSADLKSYFTFLAHHIENPGSLAADNDLERGDLYIIDHEDGLNSWINRRINGKSNGRIISKSNIGLNSSSNNGSNSKNNSESNSGITRINICELCVGSGAVIISVINKIFSMISELTPILENQSPGMLKDIRLICNNFEDFFYFSAVDISKKALKVTAKNENIFYSRQKHDKSLYDGSLYDRSSNPERKVDLFLDNILKEERKTFRSFKYKVNKAKTDRKENSVDINKHDNEWKAVRFYINKAKYEKKSRDHMARIGKYWINLGKDWKRKDFYDILIANPPYIAQDVYKNLDKEVRNFEPKKALLPGKDQDLFYRSIVKTSIYSLKKSGCLIFEVGGKEQSQRVLDLLKFFFADTGIILDGQNIPRVVFGYNKKEYCE
jgi:methylase of polypeptide subunit release factors